jgi:hypothetical protein
MKATTIIIAAVLSFQVSFLFAGNNEARPTFNSESAPLNMSTLAPVTPGEATFEETTLTNAFIFGLTKLAPTTPDEADFDDNVPQENIDLKVLTPVAPTEADFNDSIEVQSDNFSALAPVTPVEADFE